MLHRLNDFSRKAFNFAQLIQRTDNKVIITNGNSNGHTIDHNFKFKVVIDGVTVTVTVRDDHFIIGALDKLRKVKSLPAEIVEAMQ
ncbi:hypothetical protein KMB89_gp68 [Citrobacter phage HCF1]|uniref:Uncharacterized protein n=1 Tax=Citrobacter phage HCF1 TaxID=2849700 RepID=A0ABX6D4K0_9CAUD|nr:hypothetical protein KMB89_gp68 [Citrobacter phage HCF1]